MIKLLLLSAGTNANYQIAKVTKECFADQIRLIGVDINPQYLIATGIYLDAFYQVPKITDKDYYQIILNICKREGIDYLLPSIDADQMLFFPENKDLVKLKVKSLGTPEETLKFYQNKIAMNDFLRKNQFLLPMIYTPEECDDNVLYILKPVNGVGSVGVELKTGREIKLLDNIENFIIQERLSEPEVTMECFYYKDIFVSVCRERLATKAGVCTKARIFNDKELAEIGFRFSHILKTPYIFNLQFMKNKEGMYCITDVNLRTAGGMGLSYAAGWDEISALSKIMLSYSKEKVFETLPQNIGECWVVRANEDIVTKKQRPVVAFDFDGTLLDSRKRHQVVMDAVLKEFKIAIDTSNLITFKRNGKNNIDFLISKGIDEKLAREIQEKWIKCIEEERYLDLDKLYPDAYEMLNNYSKENDLILITARTNNRGLDKQIDKFGLKKYFKKVFIVPTGKEASNRKATVLKDEHALLMVGDTVHDALSAKQAGIEFKFHQNGFHSREVCEKIDKDNIAIVTKDVNNNEKVIGKK